MLDELLVAVLCWFCCGIVFVAVKTNILNFLYQIIRSFYDEYIAMPSTGNSQLLERRNWVKFDQC